MNSNRQRNTASIAKYRIFLNFGRLALSFFFCFYYPKEPPIRYITQEMHVLGPVNRKLYRP